LLRFDLADLPGWSVSEAIAVAEETGLVVPVGRWVIDAALRTAGKWVASGHPVGININVSPRQLDEGDLFEIVHTAMLKYNVPPELVTLEITEHQLVSDLDSSTRELDRVRALGVGVALDDFGTGYSSLSYLPRLPLTSLKIDRALVQRVGSARDTIPAVLLLGRDLGLTVIAEGVETREQFVRLRELGCELIQGFLTGVPVNEAQATRLAAVGRMPIAELLASFGPIQDHLAATAALGASEVASNDAADDIEEQAELPMDSCDPVAR
jgi:EAL domain-containing protein (putative c-di-GMP-specific phosphodiesterase class I)